MFYLYAAAREEGRYRALGGHAAAPDDSPSGDRYDCRVCHRPVTRTERTANGWMHAALHRGRSTRPIKAVADYFSRHHPDLSGYPVVHETFSPGTGWTRSPIRKRISRSYARKLRAEGVTRVALALGAYDHVVADFAIEELTR